ncbi:MAG: hypothetical protein V3U28_02205 [Candidatus Acidoferrales bacterium]
MAQKMVNIDVVEEPNRPALEISVKDQDSVMWWSKFGKRFKVDILQGSYLSGISPKIVVRLG